MIDLKKILRENPDCLASRTKFKAVLSDLYPTEKRLINILTVLYESGIAVKLADIREKSPVLTETEYQTILTLIENNYGIVPKYSCDAVNIWAAALGLTVQAKVISEQSVHKSNDSAVHTQKPVVQLSVKSEDIIKAEPKPVVLVEGDADDFEFAKRGDGYYITRFMGFEEDEMTIPSTIAGNPIKGIAEGAFKGLSSIKSIHVSEGIEIIKEGAFTRCSALASVTLPQTLKEIGGSNRGYCEGAFAHTGIISISIPKNVKHLGAYTFAHCKKLKQVILSDQITIIHESTFTNCWDLEQIHFPNNLKKIEFCAFDFCKKLKEVCIPNGTQEIECNAFRNTPLTSIYIPPTVFKIGAGSRGRTSIGEHDFGFFPDSLTIYCTVGSVAMEYARRNSIKYVKTEF